MMYLNDYTALAWARTRQDELLRENRDEREANVLGAEKNMTRTLPAVRIMRKLTKRS